MGFDWEPEELKDNFPPREKENHVVEEDASSQASSAISLSEGEIDFFGETKSRGHEISMRTNPQETFVDSTQPAKIFKDEHIDRSDFESISATTFLVNVMLILFSLSAFAILSFRLLYYMSEATSSVRTKIENMIGLVPEFSIYLILIALFMGTRALFLNKSLFIWFLLSMASSLVLGIANYLEEMHILSRFDLNINIWLPTPYALVNLLGIVFISIALLGVRLNNVRVFSIVFAVVGTATVILSDAVIL